MKYRLKKDLPFAKAGTVILVTSSLEVSIEIFVYNNGRHNNGRVYIYEGYIDELISEGWIEEEEVKPREWVLLCDDGIHPKIERYYSKNQLVNTGCHTEIIKVREVIE